MRNRFLCLLLALILTLPLILASCSSEAELKVEAAPVYTLYCITGETTTPQAITQIEYELNRTLFYRIGSIVKLVMVTKDEYQELIQSKQQEVQDYLDGLITNDVSGNGESAGNNESAENSENSGKTAGGGKKQSLVNTAKLSQNAIDAGYELMSGEAILNDLENGIEIELECPRLDLFLVTDYASYLEMAENEDLAALDTVLSNEAKEITSNVHKSFFNAAKVGNKTYGVPCNTIIGEYTYLVFDKNVMEQTGIAQETLLSLEDLEDYLAAVKEKCPEAVPLANSITPPTFSYMFEDGFAAYVNNNGFVRPTYSDSSVNSYFTMMTRYSALGYFENADGKTGEDSDVPFGAKFISGTKAEMEALAEKNGYVFNQYSAPVATSENSIDSIYCLSALCPESWRTAAMEVLTELYTDPALQNTLLYGIETVHYRLDNNQVTRLNQDYMMNYAHTGNCFIAYTDKDAGDSINKWEDARKQNIDARESKTIGFTFVPQEFVFGTVKDENGEDKEWSLSEPDYQEILWNIVQPHYEKLMNGTAVSFDYQQEAATAREAAMQSIRDELLETYQMRLQATYTADVKDEIISEKGEQFRATALAQTKDELVSAFSSNSRKKKLREALTEENPDASEEEIESMMEQILNDKDTLWEKYRTIVRKESQWEDALESGYQALLDEAIEQRTQAILNGSEYLRKLNAIPTSQEFLDEYNTTVELEVEDVVRQTVETALSNLIKEYCDGILAECETALQSAIDQFAKDYSDAMQQLFRQGIYDQMKLQFRDASEDDLNRYTQDWMDFIEANAEADSSKLDSAMRRLISSQYPDLDEEGAKNKLTELYKLYEETFLPLYTNAYNKELTALCKIGYAAESSMKTFGKKTEEGDPAGDGETSGETSSSETSNSTSDATTSDTTSSTETSDVSGGTTDNPNDNPNDNPGEEPGDQPTPGQYKSYFEFVLTVKFQEPYYAQFGSPEPDR